MAEPLPLVVANLKANKTWEEMTTWLEAISQASSTFPGTVVVCPSTPFLAASNQWLITHNSSLKLGSQDISHFEQGAYTGEVAASQIASLVDYAIVGHSERRQNASETDEVLETKVKNAKTAGIEPIFCVQSDSTPIPDQVAIVAYEPVSAIGTGNPDDPQNIKSTAEKLKTKSQYTVLYGGSVSADNAKAIIATVDGFLVATNSLDPQKFTAILEAIK